MILVTLAVDRDYTVVDGLGGQQDFLVWYTIDPVKTHGFRSILSLCTISRIKTILDTKSICFQCFSCNNVDKFVSL